MIKITLKQLLDIVTSINNLMALPLPARLSFRLSIEAKKLQEKFQAFEAVKAKLFEKYGELVPSENKMKIKDESVQDYLKEIEGLLSEVIVIDMEPMSPDVLGDSKISTIDMVNLSPFFVA